MTDHDKKYAELGCILFLFAAIGIFVVSFLLVAGLSWLILDFCFGLYWSWQFALGTWLLVLLIAWICKRR